MNTRRSTSSPREGAAANYMSTYKSTHRAPHNAAGSNPASGPAGITARHTASPAASRWHAAPPTPKNQNQDTAAVSFFHEFTPPTATAQGRRHDLSGAVYMPASVARAAALLQAVMEAYAPADPMVGPVRLSLLWTFPGGALVVPKVTRPDLDNLAKLALDAMTRAGYWRDDAQVVEFTTAKFAGPLPGLAVRAERWTPAKEEEA